MKKSLIAVLSLVCLLALLFAGYKISSSRSFQFFANIISRVETEEKLVALSFDDGPTEKAGSILKLLQEHDVRATFFVTGRELEENPDWGVSLVENGHELGNHSYTHPRLILKRYSFIKKEIEATDQLIRKAGYRGEIYFRPPGCKKLFMLPLYLRLNNRLTVTWDLEPDSIAALQDNSRKMAEYVIENARPGSIILMHVMYESREESIKALPEIITGLRQKGFELVTIGQLLEAEN